MSDHYELLEPAINCLKNFIERYKMLKNVEIEIKIGRLEDGIFEPGLNSDAFYDKIKQILDSSKAWIDINNTNTKEYISKDIKKVENKYIQKKRLETAIFKFNGTPYDFKITVSQELNNNCKNFKSEQIRSKNRTTYMLKECQFDLTKVETETDDEIIENEELEVELINLNSNTSDKYRAHSALLKIYDVINMCEEISKNATIVKVN
jgi:hypothetical protein